jgi:hypothetical protein
VPHHRPQSEQGQPTVHWNFQNYQSKVSFSSFYKLTVLGILSQWWKTD